MSLQSHHEAALLETARLELERAHRAALALEAGELRRGMQIALDALEEAAALAADDPHAPGASPGPLAAATLSRIAGSLEQALADLDDGRLAELGAIVEAARRDLDAGA